MLKRNNQYCGIVMNIERDFIHEVVNNFYNSIMQDGDLCGYSDASPANGNYDDEIYQKLYALKYLPAYYFEYCVLATKLVNRLKNNGADEINVSSFGCGLYPDYFALLHNLQDIEFDYYGYDICKWKTRNLLPESEDNLCLKTMSISNITQTALDDTDVFIFPKSLGDIAENIDMPSFARKIASTPKDTVYFLNSFITVNHNLNRHHVELFSHFHDALLKQGFTTDDPSDETFYRGDHEFQGLKGINYGFDYPDGIHLCEEGAELDCKCRVVHSPVMKNSYMNYQILEYTR
ncbi:hypothetical protein [Trabulsiella odontotermitis]|uniref:hypothetical protein n=1 Tax=Trabulsiella odontotermitis TaxID=379893 RepID=UPI0006760B10|nr:hypothetical protein [Trabulsiella odontotermitis]KNC92868.1 hypothetical protein GM30_14750 [Trabulsiella odontotermitis]